MAVHEGGGSARLHQSLIISRKQFFELLGWSAFIMSNESGWRPRQRPMSSHLDETFPDNSFRRTTKVICVFLLWYGCAIIHYRLTYCTHPWATSYLEETSIGIHKTVCFHRYHHLQANDLKILSICINYYTMSCGIMYYSYDYLKC